MKITQDTLADLSAVKIDTFGKVLIEEKLERKAYLKLNEVLEACGFEWSKKAKAHLCTTATLEGLANARAKLEHAIMFGDVETHQGIGFFQTPERLATQLATRAGLLVGPSGKRALEPSAGRGRIVKALVDLGATVTVVERDAGMRDAFLDAPWTSMPVDVEYFCEDFMDYTGDGWFDAVVMNPPFCKVGFGDHLDHTRHAFENFTKPGGKLVAVLPAGVKFRRDKRHTQFREWIALHRGTIEDLPDGSFAESGTNVRTVVLCMTGQEWP